MVVLSKPPSLPIRSPATCESALTLPLPAGTPPPPPSHLKNRCHYGRKILWGIKDIFEHSRNIKVVYISDYWVTIVTP